MSRGFLVLLVLAWPVAAADKPNVIAIVADDLGYAELGFQGCTDVPTPHLDALAKSGVRCTSGYVSHPFCSPTRAGFLTGRYQQRFGHENNPKWDPEDRNLGLPLDQVTLADALKQAGYATGAVGKWHLGAHPAFHPNKRGFDHYFGLLGGGHQYFDHNQFQTNPTRAKQEYFIPLVRNDKPVEETEYLTDALGREAAAFIDGSKGKPFFLYLAFNAPHTPLQAPQKYLDRVKGIEDEKRRTYGAMVCGMDDAVGRVMAKLREHKLDENTLVFFFSDNGGPIAVSNCKNTPLRAAKGAVYEGGVRVPFVVSWPAKLKPATFDAAVSSLDVFPTALAAAGATPNGVTPDGVDLLPHLRGEAKTSLNERPLFWRTGGGVNYAVRKGPHKLVRLGDKPAELYDLAADIAEKKDLAGDRPEVVAALRKELDAWDATLVAPKWSNPQPARPQPPAATAKRPNVVVILADDLGYGDVKALNPDGKIKTPHLDKLAADGMAFTDAHSGSGVCSPTRYGLITGRYSWRGKLQSGVLGGLSPRLIEPGRETVASLLKGQGYVTGAVGKWHLGMDWVLKPGGKVTELNIEPREQVFNVEYDKPIKNGPTSVGFDYYFGIAASLDMVPYTYIENDRVTANPTEDRQFRLKVDREMGLTRKGPTAPGFEVVDVLPTLTKKAVEFIDRRAAEPGKPFFLYLPLASPHTPIEPGKDWAGKSGVGVYGDFVMQTDAAVGAVLAALDRHKLADDTLVIVTSDNGCSPQVEFAELAKHGHNPNYKFRGHKADIYEGGHRVPFLVRWPGVVKAGSTSDRLVCLADICRTCAVAGGATVPDTACEDSVDFGPTLRGEKQDARPAVVHHSANGSFGIRDGAWKLCLCPGSGGWSFPRPGRDDASKLPPVQLFNLAQDLGEQTNLHDKHPEVVERLTKRLERYVADGRSTPGAAQKNTVTPDIWRAGKAAMVPLKNP